MGMGAIKYRSISLPKEFVDEVEKKKPRYMSIAEFIRLAARYYMDNFFLNIIDTEKEVPLVE